VPIIPAVRRIRVQGQTGIDSSRTASAVQQVPVSKHKPKKLIDENVLINFEVDLRKLGASGSHL
jgi:hypothetical protein